MAKQLLFEDQARAKMLKGVEKLADAVAITMGPTGRNVIINKSFGGPTVTKDGVTVSKEVELKITSRTWAPSSSTKSPRRPRTLPATARRRPRCWPAPSSRKGTRNIAAGSNPMAVRRGIEKAVEAAIEHLQDAGQAGIEQGRDRPGRRDLGQQRPRRSATCWPTPWKRSARTA